MSIVGWVAGNADGFVADAVESQFGAVASNTGKIILARLLMSESLLDDSIGDEVRQVDVILLPSHFACMILRVCFIWLCRRM